MDVAYGVGAVGGVGNFAVVFAVVFAAAVVVVSEVCAFVSTFNLISFLSTTCAMSDDKNAEMSLIFQKNK